MLLYWMDNSPRNLVLQVPGHYGVRRGTPPTLAGGAQSDRHERGQILGIVGNKLKVVGLDCLDGTPLLDIKPYFASADSVPDAVVGWHQKQD